MALPAMAAAALCWVPAFLHCEFRSMLMLQKNPEPKSVRNQQQRHYDSRNEECGSQLPRQESGVIRLVESVDNIGKAPQIEDPSGGNAGGTGQHLQCNQRQYRSNDVPIGRGMREGSRQIG